jgi:hypothetical protein
MSLHEGTASQAAEKLGFKVGRGFSPGKNIVKSMWALDPEVCFSRHPKFFGSLFSGTDQNLSQHGHRVCVRTRLGKSSAEGGARK